MMLNAADDGLSLGTEALFGDVNEIENHGDDATLVLGGVDPAIAPAPRRKIPWADSSHEAGAPHARDKKAPATSLLPPPPLPPPDLPPPSPPRGEPPLSQGDSIAKAETHVAGTFREGSIGGVRRSPDPPSLFSHRPSTTTRDESRHSLGQSETVCPGGVLEASKTSEDVGSRKRPFETEPSLDHATKRVVLEHPSTSGDSAPAFSAPFVHVIWEFSVRDGFEPFHSDSQKSVEELYQNYLRGGDEVIKVSTQGHKVNIDFKSMQQYLEGSVRKRKVQRRLVPEAVGTSSSSNAETSTSASSTSRIVSAPEAPPVEKPIWEFRVKDGFKPFPAASQNEVEKQFQSFATGGASVGRVEIAVNQAVLLDFKTMKQQSEVAGRARDIRRRLM